eukprot:12670945-Alexandrium_andersonii.AAC.1
MRPCRVEFGADPEVFSGTSQLKFRTPEAILHVQVFMGRNTLTAIRPSGQRDLGAQHPAQGGRGPSTPTGPNGPLRASEPAKVGDPHCE